MIRDPASLAWLREGADRRDRDDPDRRALGLSSREARDEEAERLALRRFRQREMLRIGYNDIVRGLPLELIDARPLAPGRRLRRGRLPPRPPARRGAARRPPRARRRDRRGSSCSALGKLGGEELNYSSDIDLIFLYDDEGQTDGPTADLQRRVLRQDGRRPRPPALRPLVAGAGLPGRHAAAGPRATRGPWPARWRRRSAITRRPAGPGSDRP